MTTARDWAASALGYEFAEPLLCEQALTHRSSSNCNNERLEFLGDAVLGLVIAEALHDIDAAADEGALSRLRAALVRRETLAAVARDTGLGDRLQLGAGESRSGGHQRRSIMADALEAVFGAVYLDGGYAAARDVILRLYADRLANLPDPAELKDAKTRLQEALQSAALPVPSYRVVDSEGPPHARRFAVECTIPELDIAGRGEGTSRRRAEQQAAEAALARFLAVRANAS